MAEPTRDEIYGYPISAYKCDCWAEHNHTYPTWKDGQWWACMAGYGWTASPEQTPQELRDRHVNLRPSFPAEVQALIDQVARWELRALRAEAQLHERTGT